MLASPEYVCLSDLCTPERGRGIVIFLIKPGAGGEGKKLPPRNHRPGVNGETEQGEVGEHGENRAGFLLTGLPDLL